MCVCGVLDIITQYYSFFVGTETKPLMSELVVFFPPDSSFNSVVTCFLVTVVVKSTSWELN